MKIISWNVNGIRAAWNHGLSHLMYTENADIYAFQETKLSQYNDFILPEGYYIFESICTRQKGYSGTMCLSRWKPRAVSYNFTIPSKYLNIKDNINELIQNSTSFDCEGRIITLEFDKFFFVNCYYPNSQGSKIRYDYRNEWDAKVDFYLQKLMRIKDVIVCGDFNVTYDDDDIYPESQWINWSNEGFKSLERDHFHVLIDNGFIDTYRHLHPYEFDKYSWWSNRLNKRDENKGWRLDYFLVSKEIIENVTESTMLTEIRGSDHCPLVFEINIEMTDIISSDIGNDIGIKYIQKATQADIDYLITSKINFDYSILWDNIDWDEAENNLKTMQMALTKSAYTKHDELIEKWQNRILYSLDARLLAVKYVSESNSPPGIDNVVWTTSHEKVLAALSLSPKNYQASPTKMLIVKSKSGKSRHIHIATYYDHAMQTLCSMALDPIAEAWAERKSFAFRKGRSALDMNEYIRLAFSLHDTQRKNDIVCPNNTLPEWVFIGDIKKCYEHISHEWILENIPLNKKVLNEFLKAGYIFAGEFFSIFSGVGIGLSLSPIIANMTLDGLSTYIFTKTQNNQDEIDYKNHNLIRYADDILITARSKEDALAIGEIVRDYLLERGLTLSEEKTRIVNINDGFDFMSRTYIKIKSNIYIFPSNNAVNRFLSDIQKTIDYHMGSQQSLIEKINRKIVGWATFHKVSDADDAFRYVDSYIKALLMRLCKKKHPSWSNSKILEKYWFVDEKGRQVYALPDKKETRVKFLSDIELVVHTRVKTNLNPYIEFDYIEKRATMRVFRNVTGFYKSIWNRQSGLCYYCGQKILRDQEKWVIDINPNSKNKISRYAYIHYKCLNKTLEYINTDTPPDTNTDLLSLLDEIKDGSFLEKYKYKSLSDYFKVCSKSKLLLSFSEIEEILGWKLGKSKKYSSFWQKTGFRQISQCWLENGYKIQKLDLLNEKITFQQFINTTVNLEIPDSLINQRIPAEAKYEIENYFKYILKKYGL